MHPCCSMRAMPFPRSSFTSRVRGGPCFLEDGTLIRLAYAGQNGRPYTAVGRVLIQNGQVDRAHLSADAGDQGLA